MKKGLVRIILFYQKWIRPFLPKTCIFEVSCSEYMKQVVLAEGVLQGMIKGGWRLLQCQSYFLLFNNFSLKK